MSLGKWMVKQTGSSTPSILLSSKKELLIHNNLDEPPRGKRPILKGYIVCVHVIQHSWNENVQQWRTDWWLPEAKGGWGWEAGVAIKGGILVVMEMVSILTESVSICWMWYCTTVVQDVTTERNWVKGTELFHTIVCESSYHKIQRLKVVLRNYIDGGY